MDSIERLALIFERFPGIGPRQAGRFVQYILRLSPALRRELADAIRGVGISVKQCASCYRFASFSGRLCAICNNPARDQSTLAIVAADTDIAALERPATYNGLYFVLGGTISLVSEQMSGLRLKQLLDSLDERVENGLREIILAFPANPEGDATAERVRAEIGNTNIRLKITALGRGLSTGSELEYADPETLKSALESRR